MRAGCTFQASSIMLLGQRSVHLAAALCQPCNRTRQLCPVCVTPAVHHTTCGTHVIQPVALHSCASSATQRKLRRCCNSDICNSEGPAQMLQLGHPQLRHLQLTDTCADAASTPASTRTVQGARGHMVQLQSALTGRNVSDALQCPVQRSRLRKAVSDH